MPAVTMARTRSSWEATKSSLCTSCPTTRAAPLPLPCSDSAAICCWYQNFVTDKTTQHHLQGDWCDRFAAAEAVSEDELAAARDCAGGAQWLGEEVASSERPELATAKVVVAGVCTGMRV